MKKEIHVATETDTFKFRGWRRITEVNIASIKGCKKEDWREIKRGNASDTEPRTSSVNND